VPDGHNAPRLIYEFVPRLAAEVDDIVVGSEHPVGEPVVAHELPDILNRVEFRTFGRERYDADIVRHVQLVSHMPTGLIHQYNSVSARSDGERYFCQMERHGFGIAERQHQPRALAVLRADRAEDIDRFSSLIFGCRWPRPATGPAPRDLVLLPDPRFVLKPDLYRRALRERSSDLCQLGGKAPFLKASIASSFCAWWRGRAVSLT
jgi:hypothetical protein